MAQTPSSVQTPHAQDFTLRFLNHHGASIHPLLPPQDNLWRASLHTTLAQHIGQSILQIAFDPAFLPDEDDTHLAVPGSPLFDRFGTWLAQRGASLWRALAPNHKPPKSLPKNLSPDTKSCRVLHATPSLAFDLELASQIAFVDEGRDERIKLCWSPADGLPSLLDQSNLTNLLPQLLPTPPDPTTAPAPNLLHHRLLSACTELQHWATQEATRKEAALLERLSREVHRLTTYYGELMAQHEQEDLLREQLADDLNRRVTEELSHHRLRVVLQPLQYALLSRSQHTYTCKLGRASDAPTQLWRLDLTSGLWFDPAGIAIDPA